MASHRGAAVSMPWQSMLDVVAKWYWERLFCKSFGFIQSVYITHMLQFHLPIIHRLYWGLLGATLLWRYFQLILKKKNYMPDDRGIVFRSSAEIIFSKTSILSLQDKPNSYLIIF